ncbi:MAG: hypothetical protein ACLRX4_14790 [Oscillospiraceae bacterium]
MMLRSKRENGQYCACPPYGYRKDTKDKHRLAPDEMTAPVVLRIFEQAAREIPRGRSLWISMRTASSRP